MTYTNQQLVYIFNKTGGLCSICGLRIVYAHYGDYGRIGDWEVDHIIPKARGGSDAMSNLAPACISCNRSKQAY